MRLQRQVIDELLAERDADPEAGRRHQRQEPVEVSAALAQAVAVACEGHSGYDDDVEARRIDVAGHDAQTVAVDVGKMDVETTADAPLDELAQVGLTPEVIIKVNLFNGWRLVKCVNRK